jgi:formate dehydrogenase major subunit
MGHSNSRSLLDRLRDWPLTQQLADVIESSRPLSHEIAELGMGDEALSPRTREIQPRTRDADVTQSVCPYCAVGCSTLIYSRGNRIINIEGNPDSPINAGTLCPKGAATYQLTINPDRITKVLYRAPHSTRWETRPLSWAMDRIAERIKDTRDAGFTHEQDGNVINQTPNLAVLGGATLDNEENYVIKKLFTGGLGVVWLENQARI